MHSRLPIMICDNFEVAAIASNLPGIQECLKSLGYPHSTRIHHDYLSMIWHFGNGDMAVVVSGAYGGVVSFTASLFPPNNSSPALLRTSLRSGDRDTSELRVFLEVLGGRSDMSGTRESKSTVAGTISEFLRDNEL